MLMLYYFFRSGQHNYVFNLSSPTVKEEWQADVLNAKLALGRNVVSVLFKRPCRVVS